MKLLRKLIPITLIIIFAACKNKNDATRNIRLLNDSSAYNNSSSTDSLEAKQENKATGSYSYYPKKSEANKNQKEKSISENREGQVKQAQNSSGNPDQDQKKGWSKGAQGAVIGAATGAVGGAIISKHKGTGAAIGAAVGAAGGYIIGHEKDKKDGRIKQK